MGSNLNQQKSSALESFERVVAGEVFVILDEGALDTEENEEVFDDVDFLILDPRSMLKLIMIIGG